MSSFQKGKKRFFSATNPEQLLSVLGEQKHEIEKREKVVEAIVGDLKALAAFSLNAPQVSHYEGWDGINSLREDILRSDVQEMFELVSLDDVRRVVSGEGDNIDLKKKIKTRVALQTLYTCAEGKILPDKTGKNEARYLPKNKFPVSCEVVIYGTKVAFLSYSGKPSGILIDDNNVAITMKIMFKSLWLTAK